MRLIVAFLLVSASITGMNDMSDSDSDIIGPDISLFLVSPGDERFIPDLDEDKECILCMRPYDDKKRKRIDLVCDKKRPHVRHEFCKDCLDTWKTKNDSCPTCRRVMSKKTRICSFMWRLCSR